MHHLTEPLCAVLVERTDETSDIFAFSVSIVVRVNTNNTRVPRLLLDHPRLTTKLAIHLHCDFYQSSLKTRLKILYFKFRTTIIEKFVKLCAFCRDSNLLFHVAYGLNQDTL